MESLPIESFYEIMCKLSDQRDCAALACVSHSLNDLVSSSQKLGDINKTQKFGIYYDDIRLSEQQLDGLNYLNSLLDVPNPHAYCVLPMSSGKTLLSLVYCVQRSRETDKPCIIAIPTKAFSTYREEVDKFFPKERVVFVTGKCYLTYQSARGVYIIDRSKIEELALERNSVACVFVDEAHTGDTSRKYIYNEVHKANKLLDRPVQLVMMSASSKIAGYESHDNVVRVSIGDEELELNVYISQTILNPYLADINFYPCITGHNSYYNPIVESKYVSKNNDKDFSILLQVISTTKERILVMVRHFGDDLCDKLKKHGLDAGYCAVQKTFSLFNQRIVIIPASRFSESINITNFSNLFLYDYSGSSQKARQCIGRIQRTTNTSKLVNVWITTSNPILAFSIIPPKSMLDDYTCYLGKAPGSDLHRCFSTSASDFVPGMSLAEITAICHTSINVNKTKAWLNKVGTNIYSAEEIAAIIKPRNRVLKNKVEQCRLSEMKPIRVNYRSQEQQSKSSESDETPSDLNTEMLKQIISAPNKRGTYTVVELKKFCSDRNLKLTGNKAELAQRLLDHSASMR